MWLKKFRATLLDHLLAFLWKEWGALGVTGGNEIEENWILDPESLFTFSLPLARYEPRLFDEIMGWFTINGHWLDTSRLRGLLQKADRETIRVVGAALDYGASHIDKRKWKNLADMCATAYDQKKSRCEEPLFREKSGKGHPLLAASKSDPHFARFGLRRSKLGQLKSARMVPINSKTNIRFLLRSLFGLGARSESILYLLTHDGGRPKEIAEAVGLFWLSVQQMLRDMSHSKLIRTRRKIRKVEYWISKDQWWRFLCEGHPPGQTQGRWLNWSIALPTLLHLWRTTDQLSNGKRSEYIIKSQLQDEIETMAQELSRSELDLPTPPTEKISIRFQQRWILQSLKKMS